MTTATACPHCGRELLVSNFSTHVAVCVRDPATHARIAAVLPDPDRPGYAISSVEYNRLSGRLRLPSVESIRRQYGSWMNACAAFGLKSVNRYSGYRSPATSEAERMAALDAEVERLRAAASPPNVYRDWQGLECCAVREIDGGKRLAWMVR